MKLSALQQYGVVTTNYWAFTLTDGALRMLVLFHFHSLGYSTLEIAFLFLFYESFGIITNLYGGWIGAQYGLRLTLWVGTLLQIIALVMLIPVIGSWPKVFGVTYVMFAQAISGVAKDLNKMSAKSAIKTVIPETSENESQSQKQLFKWVAVLTGSKNALKGVGFFLGGFCLMNVGFNKSVGLMAIGLGLSFLLTLILPSDIGRVKSKPILKDLFAKSEGINILSAARFFLFGARDVWFVVALPVFLETSLGWNFWRIGSFLGLWLIGYGIVQGLAPGIRKLWGKTSNPGPSTVRFWSATLTAIPSLIAIALFRGSNPALAIIAGLIAFGVVFAINSSIHSYMVLAYADEGKISLDVGFYYMANAAGRLAGTLLSGTLFMIGENPNQGMQLSLWCSTLFVFSAWLISQRLPSLNNSIAVPEKL